MVSRVIWDEIFNGVWKIGPIHRRSFNLQPKEESEEQSRSEMTSAKNLWERTDFNDTIIVSLFYQKYIKDKS